MDIKTYSQESEKTLSGQFHYDKDKTEPTLKKVLDNFIAIGQELDQVKKAKYYGREIDFSFEPEKDAPEFKRDEIGEEHLLHGAIGVATEAVELLEAVRAAKFEGKELDAVNIKEELGDFMWYVAIFLRDLDIDFHDALQINIDKLRARYGEKFSSEKANNRDLDTERDILEK